MAYGKVTDLDRDVYLGRDFLDGVVRVGDEIRSKVQQGLNKGGLSAELIYAGSTNPQRLTTIVDPKSPDSRYTCDFDAALITDGKSEKTPYIDLIRQLFPIERDSLRFGRTEFDFYYQKFPVSISIFTPEEANVCAPIIYNLNHAKFDQEEIHEMRKARLFSMRNGIYGGYNRGLKGITIEQLVHQLGGNWRSVLEKIASLNEQEVRELIKNPVNGKYDLVSNLHSDIIRRMKVAGEKYLEGQTRSSPYSFSDWEEDQAGRLNFELSPNYSEPRQTRLDVENALEESGESKKESRVIVIPKYRDSQVLVSLADKNCLGRNHFMRKFVNNWDKLEK